MFLEKPCWSLLKNVHFLAVTFFSSEAVASKECVPMDQSVEHLLPSLLSLISDPVPNTRVLLAKALRPILLEKGYLGQFSELTDFKLRRTAASFCLSGTVWYGILQINYTNWYILCMCMYHVLSHIPLFATPWTVACQVPPYGVCQGRLLEWVAFSYSRESSWPRDQTRIFCVSCIAGRFFTHQAIREALLYA